MDLQELLKLRDTLEDLLGQVTGLVKSCSIKNVGKSFEDFCHFIRRQNENLGDVLSCTTLLSFTSGMLIIQCAKEHYPFLSLHRTLLRKYAEEFMGVGFSKVIIRKVEC